MADLSPFKAVRPCKENLQHFSSKSYKSYTAKELKQSLSTNPLSFLSIIHLKKNASRSLQKSERYQLVKNKFDDFKSENVLIKDLLPAFYIYETVQKEGHMFCGIIAGASVKDYNTNVIKKHEATLSKRENTFKTYLKTVRFNATPVLLTYKEDQSLEKTIQTAKENASEIETWNSENETHKLWCVNDSETIHLIQKAFEEVPSLYIADGHHRSASSALLANEIESNSTLPKDKNYTHFLSYLIPEKQLKV